MLLSAVLRRSSSRFIRVTGLASTTVLVCTAASSYGAAAAATPYPPSPPCNLSWFSPGAADPVLVGSGYGVNTRVTVTQYPQAQTLGSYPTDSSGAFTAPLGVPRGEMATLITARSATRSCSVPPPSGPTTTPTRVPTSAPGPSGTPTSSGASGSPTSGSTGGSSGTGGSTTGGSGAGDGGSGGQGPAGHSSGAGRSSSSARPTPTPGSTSTPSGGSTSSSAGRSTAVAPPRADQRNASTLGLPLWTIVVIAALLVLAGGLAVLVSTRRTQ